VLPSVATRAHSIPIRLLPLCPAGGGGAGAGIAPEEETKKKETEEIIPFALFAHIKMLLLVCVIPPSLEVNKVCLHHQLRS
jgi:hypothetical protein